MSYTTQQIYDKVVNHMRAQGSKGQWMAGFYLPGSRRDWTYVNPKNPCERCAKGILMNVYKNNKNEYVTNKDQMIFWPDKVEAFIGRQLKDTEIWMLDDLETTFETLSEKKWEKEFKSIAERCSVIYTEQSKIEINTKEEIKHGAKSKA